MPYGETEHPERVRPEFRHRDEPGRAYSSGHLPEQRKASHIPGIVVSHRLPCDNPRRDRLAGRNQREIEPDLRVGGGRVTVPQTKRPSYHMRTRQYLARADQEAATNDPAIGGVHPGDRCVESVGGADRYI